VSETNPDAIADCIHTGCREPPHLFVSYVGGCRWCGNLCEEHCREAWDKARPLLASKAHAWTNLIPKTNHEIEQWTEKQETHP
jgi:hypothetical protein